MRKQHQSEGPGLEDTPRTANADQVVKGTLAEGDGLNLLHLFLLLVDDIYSTSGRCGVRPGASCVVEVSGLLV